MPCNVHSSKGPGVYMHLTLIILNLIASLASAVFAAIALAKPQFLSRSSVVEGGERFYVRMYAARSVPLALAAGLLPFLYSGPPVSLFVFTAASIQGADVLIAAERKEAGMITGAAVGLIVHVLCGLAIW